MKKFLLILLIASLFSLPLMAKENDVWIEIPLPAYGVLDCWTVYSENFSNLGYMLDPIFCAIGTSEKDMKTKIMGHSTTIKKLYEQGWHLLVINEKGISGRHYILTKSMK
ncbi:MAG: hypothetical protein OEY59_09160 [Deltaproteobacteria bacterium]|nr:hypothetical protein [Deltaproteobacteria bacterium]